MAAKFVGAIDQGTTSTRFIVFDHAGRLIGSKALEHEQKYPDQGWVEHDPLQIWRNTVAVIADTLAEASLTAADLVSVGITNQRETTVVWDKTTGQPYYNAIVWNDMRTRDMCDDMASEHKDGQNRFVPVTGLPLVPYFSGSKLRWLLKNVPAVREGAAAGNAVFGTIDTWLVWNLTGGASGGIHVTDVTNASRTLLMDLKTLDWSDEQLAAFEVPRSMLPAVKASSEVYGTAVVDALKGVPVAGILGDQQAALFGQSCFEAGSAKNTYGTGCFMLLNTGNDIVFSKAGLLTTVAYKLGSGPAVYALEGSVAQAGSVMQWMRDGLKLFDSVKEVQGLVTSVPDNGGVYFVPAFSGLFAPHWCTHARGAILGLTGYARKEHIVRAGLEATAFQTREVLEAMAVDGVRATLLKVDGGMTANEFLMQFQADILNLKVVRAQVLETTALGAAYAAGLAVGFWSGVEELKALWQAGKVWTPDMTHDDRSALFHKWEKAVEKSKHWIE